MHFLRLVNFLQIVITLLPHYKNFQVNKVSTTSTDLTVLNVIFSNPEHAGLTVFCLVLTGKGICQHCDSVLHLASCSAV